MGKSNKQNLSISSWNIHGIKEKLDNDLFLKRMNIFDINIVLETWHGVHENISIKGYNSLSKARPKNKKAWRCSGGICIFYKNTLSNSIEEINCKHNSPNVLWFKLNKIFYNLKVDLYVCAAYIPPEGSPYFKDDFSVIQSNVNELRNLGNIMLLGDFNAKIGNLNDYVIQDDNVHVNSLIFNDYVSDDDNVRNSQLETINNYGTQLIDLCFSSKLRILNGRFIGDLLGTPTCFQYNGCSTIDYIISSCELLTDIQHMCVYPLSVLSDHCQLGVVLKTKFHSNPCLPKPKLDRFPHSIKLNEEHKQNFVEILSNSEIANKLTKLENKSLTDINVNDFNDSLTSLLIQAGDQCVKPRKAKRSRYKAWFNHNLETLYKKVEKMSKNLSKDPHNEALRRQYFIDKKDLKRNIKRSKYDYFSSLRETLTSYSSENPKEFWKLLKKLKSDPQECNETTDITADEWISHYQNLGKNGKFTIENNVHESTSFENTLTESLITDRPITISEVKKFINSLKCGKSMGLDGLETEMLKYGKNVIVSSITKLFNCILNTSTYPESWRKTYIMSLHKKGDKANPNNYRGISISSQLCKLFNSILNSRIQTLLEEKLSENQFGFRKNHRTSDNLLILKTLTDKYLKSLKKPIFIAFVDFQKAFDSVWRDALLVKLAKCGIGSKCFNVIKSLYEKTTSVIKLNNKITDEFQIDLGVRQGDPLSPTLFNIFIDDMQDIFNLNCHPITLGETKLNHLMFADDVVLMSESAEGLQNCLNKLANYSDYWHLTVNTSKTKTMTISNSRKILITKPFALDGTTLDHVEKFNYLGTIISKNGSFTEAMNNLAQKGSKAFNALMSKLSSINPDANMLCKLFHTLIRPIITYNADIWYSDVAEKQHRASNRCEKKGKTFDHLSQIDSTSLEKLHIKVSKQILHLPRSSSNIAARSELGLIPIEKFIRRLATKNFERITKLNDNKLVKVALKESEHLHKLGLYSWYSFVVESEEMDETNNSDYYEKLLLNKINKKDDNKLRTYATIKSKIDRESYLQYIKNTKHCNALTKLRVSSHKLRIETGRYEKIPPEKRTCSLCNVPETEIHFLIECHKNHCNRQTFLAK